LKRILEREFFERQFNTSFDLNFF
mgnify:CR=1